MQDGHSLGDWAACGLGAHWYPKEILLESLSSLDIYCIRTANTERRKTHGSAGLGSISQHELLRHPGAT
jgi:hypothetical protein